MKFPHIIIWNRFINSLSKSKSGTLITPCSTKCDPPMPWLGHHCTRYHMETKHRHLLKEPNPRIPAQIGSTHFTPSCQIPRSYSTDDSKDSDPTLKMSLNVEKQKLNLTGTLDDGIDGTDLNKPNIDQLQVTSDIEITHGSSSDSSSDSGSSDSDSELDLVSSSRDTPEAPPESRVTGVDVDQELLRYNFEEYEDFEAFSEDAEEEEEEEPSFVISPERGSTGVYDIEHMVELLEKENAQNLCVISVPKETNFVDYMVIASGKSQRHLQAITTTIKKMYKVKRGRCDRASVQEEGTAQSGWIALDLGNMAVHLMTPDLRDEYDLETLWTVGSEYDEKTQADADGEKAQITSTDIWDWSKPEQKTSGSQRGANKQSPSDSHQVYVWDWSKPEQKTSGSQRGTNKQISGDFQNASPDELRTNRGFENENWHKR